MKPRTIIIGLVAISISFHPASAQQRQPRMSFGVIGGGNVSIDRVDLTERAWHAGAIAELRSGLPGVSFRFEALYFSSTFPPGFVTDSIGTVIGELTQGERLIGGTANAVFRARFVERSTQLYVIGGVGVFGIQQHTEWPAGRLTLPIEMRPGVNAGAGVETRVRRLTAFAEARYHVVRRAAHTRPLKMVPVSLGLRVR